MSRHICETNAALEHEVILGLADLAVRGPLGHAAHEVVHEGEVGAGPYDGDVVHGGGGRVEVQSTAVQQLQNSRVRRHWTRNGSLPIESEGVKRGENAQSGDALRIRLDETQKRRKREFESERFEVVHVVAEQRGECEEDDHAVPEDRSRDEVEEREEHEIEWRGTSLPFGGKEGFTSTVGSPGPGSEGGGDFIAKLLRLGGDEEEEMGQELLEFIGRRRKRILLFLLFFFFFFFLLMERLIVSVLVILLRRLYFNGRIIREIEGRRRRGRRKRSREGWEKASGLERLYERKKKEEEKEEW